MAVRAVNQAEDVPRGPFWLSAKKVGLLIAAALVSVNIWTGAPLAALWVGSQAQGGSGLSMGTVFLVILTLAAIVFALATALSWVNARYDDLIGKPRPERQEYPWLRSLSAEREQWIKRDRGVTGVERAVVLSVVAAVLGFEIWFFFFAKYTFAGG